MGAVKRWFEDRIPEMTDDELSELGYSQDEIEFLRECFPGEES